MLSLSDKNAQYSEKRPMKPNKALRTSQPRTFGSPSGKWGTLIHHM